MINITVIGMMGEGKTTFIKKYIRNRRQFIFDVQNEYKELQVASADKKSASQLQSRMIELDAKKFMQQCLLKRNTCCVFEDATGFIEGKLGEDFRKSWVSKRHTGNVNIAVFHSIHSVPPRILQLSDYVVLFKTNDEDYQVLKKYPSLYNAYYRLRNKPKYTYELVKI